MRVAGGPGKAEVSGGTRQGDSRREGGGDILGRRGRAEWCPLNPHPYPGEDARLATLPVSIASAAGSPYMGGASL